MPIIAAVFRVSQQAGGRQFEEQILDDLSQDAPVTADVNSDIIDLGEESTARLFLDVTAVSGTLPTLDVTIQHSHDGVTFATLATFTQKTAISSERKEFTGARHYLRAFYDVGGTLPSFTCTLTGTAS